jgi:hypothetical protein
MWSNRGIYSARGMKGFRGKVKVKGLDKNFGWQSLGG